MYRFTGGPGFFYTAAPVQGTTSTLCWSCSISVVRHPWHLRILFARSDCNGLHLLQPALKSLSWELSLDDVSAHRLVCSTPLAVSQLGACLCMRAILSCWPVSWPQVELHSSADLAADVHSTASSVLHLVHKSCQVHAGLCFRESVLLHHVMSRSPCAVMAHNDCVAER
jgi:hypothetical protein